MPTPVFFERPDGPPIVLRSTPRLSNWNRSGDTGQARLTRALSFSDGLIDPQLAACGGPVAVRFDVGLPRASRLLEERDLDNYLLPLAAHLEERSPEPIVSVWGGKRYGDVTALKIGPARPQPDGPGTVTLRTTVSGTRGEFKSGLRAAVQEAVSDAEPLPDGPVILEVAFVVGPARSWLDLWWSTLDGLGPILGRSPFEPEFRPRDGRVADLGLHRVVDDDLGDDVVIALRSRPGWLDPVPPE